MSPQYFTLTPQDAWFFRDGRPYNRGESNQADVESLFPPPARTLTGAVRAALARANGWNGQRGSWPASVTEAFGSAPDDLGKVQFSGLFVIHGNEDGEEKALWPIPRHLLGRFEAEKWKPKAFLVPGGEFQTDQGKIKLPKILSAEETHDGLKSDESAWITATGLAQILADDLPSADAVFQPEQLWRHETRVGLKRNEITHQVDEADLYSPSYVRLCRQVALGFGLAGIPNGMNSLPTLFPLGGESRLAQCDLWNDNPLPKSPSADSFQSNAENHIEFAVILITPGRFADAAPLLHPNAKTLSACVGKPVSVGGWDSLANRPLPLEPFHPAGSVWFCEVPAEVFRQSIHCHHGGRIGDYSAHGFGQIVIGRCPRTLHSDQKT
jgi:CRISPR-associated protein Cmr3